ncbi:MAG: hypothetical protein JWR83_2381 [Aeromicrobium sp.]|nr:hypothetical protein [Aeromicrobium sp.]
MARERNTRVLIITDKTATTPELIEAIRTRAERPPVQFRMVIPNPAAAELHLLHPERHTKATEAEIVLLESLPAIQEAAGRHVIGSVSIRHDPMDAVEEILFSEPVDEIIVSVANHSLSRWIHQDLAHRLEHFGLPITVVEGPEAS